MKSRTEKLLDGLDLASLIGVEIGPLHKPLVSKSAGHVIYIDHTDADALRQHYAHDKGVDTNAIGVDAIWNGTYHDVHCWVFTPLSFAQLFLELSRHNLVDFACVDFYDTVFNDSEFMVTLRICDNPSERGSSWQRMVSMVNRGSPEAHAAPAARYAGATPLAMSLE